MSHNHAHKLSALDEIDATLQRIGPQPPLRAEVDRLVELKDVSSLVALYEAYGSVSFVNSLSGRNRGPISGTV
jgi:hypothetical protein